MPAANATSKPELVQQLAVLGVKRGGVLLLHSSFRAVGPVEAGPVGLIQALLDALGPGGTLVMPSWSESDDEPFDPSETEPARDLGVVPRVFWRLPNVLRSNHLQAFAAVGARAEEVLQDGLPLPPHIPESPVGRVHELDGQVLLLGVDHDANTTIHLAELLAPVRYRTPRYCTILRDGQLVRIDYEENDHCGERFVLVGDWLEAEGLQAQGPVGHAAAKLASSRAIVRVVVDHLRKDPLQFLHPSSAGCTECDEARKSVPVGAPAPG